MLISTEEIDLHAFAGGDERAAAAAFDRLSRSARSFLQVYLRSRLPGAADLEDVVQESLTALWSFRRRFRNQGVAAWYALVKRTADHRVADFYRGRTPADAGPPIEAIPEAEIALLEEPVCLLVRLESERIEHAATVLWLGLDPEMPERTHVRRLLAAQLFYRDRVPWERILDLLGAGGPVEQAPDREELDHWLSDPAVHRHLAYRTLYLSGDALAAHLLCPDEPAGLADLALAASRNVDEPPPRGWSWEEVRVVLWRYRHALLAEQIAARRDHRMTRRDMEALFDRCRAQFPFRRLMVELLRTLPGRAREYLAEPGLWQRLVFQYGCRDGLPHRDIQERSQPAAAEVGFQVTPGMLNVWLSNGRLARKLAAFLSRQGGEAADG